MATTQKGLVIEKPGAPFQVVSTIKKSTPSPKQALVKSLLVAINPVEEMMAKTGILTTSMPAILGSDFCGLVIEAGSECTKLQTGDSVFGLCRLGQNRYSPFQETFLVDEDTVFKRENGVDAEVAAGLGVGVLTSAFGMVVGGNIRLPHHGTKFADAEHDEWIVVLGGSGTVGQYAVQIGRLCGYKVAASCSPIKTPVVLQAGASETFNNRGSVVDQAADIKAITGGRFSLIFDASGLCHEVALEAFEQSAAKQKYFSTTDNSIDFKPPSGIHLYRVLTGQIGREGTDAEQITAQAAEMVPILDGHIADGTIKPVECEMYKGVGWDRLIQAIEYYEQGLARRKLVVRVQEG